MKCGSEKIIGKKLPDHIIQKCNNIKTRQNFFYLFQSPSKKTSDIYKTGNEEETKKDGKKISTASTGGPGNQANAMRILVLAQKGDWTACESTLKALERSAMDEGGPRNPLANISDNVRKFFN